MPELGAALEIDLATRDDVESIISSAFRRNEKYIPFSETIYPTKSLMLDSSGNGSDTIFRCPAGSAFELNRLIVQGVTSAGVRYTAAVPFTNGAGYVEFFRGNEPMFANIFDWIPYVSGGVIFPNVAEYGTRGPKFKQGEDIFVSVTGGPVSGSCLFIMQGILTENAQITISERRGVRGSD